VSRPRFLGVLGERAVFRFDDADALHRVMPRAVSSRPGPFKPGLYLDAFGRLILLPRSFAEDAKRMGRDLDACCSTPRLARSIVALDAERRVA